MKSHNNVPPFLLSIKDGVSIGAYRGRPALKSPHLIVPIHQNAPRILEIAKLLCAAPTKIDRLQVEDADDESGRSQLRNTLQSWEHHGLLCHSIQWSGGLLATVVPTTTRYQLDYQAPDPEKLYLLSRFAYCRRGSSLLRLESPLSHCRIELHDWRASAMVHALASGADIKQLKACSADLTAPQVEQFLGLLIGAGLLNALSPAGQPQPTEETESLQQWDFHDLLFHSLSRQGRQDATHGKTERFRETLPPLPSVKPPMSEHVIELAKPQGVVCDSPLIEVLESRKSTRHFGDHPLTLRQLGEFLFLSARSEPAPTQAPRSYEFDRRPYPSGGACYELEIYVAVGPDQCLDPGLYHYQPRRHALHRLPTTAVEIAPLLAAARHSSALEPGQSGASEPILIVIAARFQRVGWAYESIAYSLILKHVGVLFQTMYLVAQALGLGICALGSGDSDAFARASGLDYVEEGSVGELLLGSSRSG